MRPEVFIFLWQEIFRHALGEFIFCICLGSLNGKWLKIDTVTGEQKSWIA